MTRYKLSEICKIVSGSTPKTNVPEYWDGENVWITPAEITDKTFIVYDSQRKLSNLGVEKTHLSSFPKGTVILSSRAPIGKVAIAGVEMFCNQGFKNLICSEKIMNEYLYWFLKGKTKYLNSLGRGATFKELSAKIIGNIELEVPSIQEQKEVVIRLRKIDQIIGVFEREVELLDELIKARFVEMFGDPIYNTQNRPMTEFINVVKMQRGYDLPVQDRNHEGSIPVYGANGVLGYHDVAKINNGGIITGRSGTIGKVYLANKEYWPLNTSLFSIETYGNNLIYLQYLVTLYDLKRFVEGTGVPTLNRNMFHNKKIIEVPINEQNTFASFVEEIDKSRSRIQKSLEASQELFDSLMQDYFG